MNAAIPLLVTVALYVLASRFYAGWIARSAGLDATRPTPACSLGDGRDFVPTGAHVIFAHHFSAIAGAGPILGPTMALLYGFYPSWIWILAGAIFIGAVHDFSALFMSVRESGRSMAEIARIELGKTGYILFILFTLMMLVLVNSAFLRATATSLTSMWPLAKLGLSEGQTLLKSVRAGGSGELLGVIGGIASTSVIIITALSPLLGYFLYRRRLPMKLAYPAAFAASVASIVAGICWPVAFSPETWMVILSFYVLVAAGLPVWLILQPRDFINVQILYGGMILLTVAVLAGGAAGLQISAPSLNLADGASKLGFIWPMLFITVACGAVSGFHALVAGGTTSKQLSTETDVRRIGYNAMLLEGFLAVCVLITVASSLPFDDYRSMVWPEGAGAKANPILAFSLGVGGLLQRVFSIPTALGSVFGILMVEGFVITTLDASVRFNRYLLEELWNVLFAGRVPRALGHYWVNSGIAVLLMWVLAYFNAFQALWPIFGAGNQLLSALTLIVVSIYLAARGRRMLFSLLPALFMAATTVTALAMLLRKYFLDRNATLTAAAVFLLCLAVGTAFVALPRLVGALKNGKSTG